MRCHICSEAATGQCQSCWKFYCEKHGDRVCELCQGDLPQRWNPAQRLTAIDRPLRPDEEHTMGFRVPGMMEGNVLERVIPVGETKSHGDSKFTLLSLELYDDGFIINYVIGAANQSSVIGPTMLMFAFADAFISATDDLGSSYSGLPGNGGGGGGDRQWRGQIRLTPQVHPGAHSLTVIVREIRWNASGFGQGEKSRLDLGPWEFHVEL